MGHPRLLPVGPESHRTAAQQRYSRCHIAIDDLEPPVINRALRTEDRETLLGRHRNQLVYPLAEECVISVKRKQASANVKATAKDGV